MDSKLTSNLLKRRKMQNSDVRKTDLKTLLLKEELIRFSKLKPYIAIKDSVISWTLIFLSWTLVASLTNPATLLVAIMVIASRYYALLIIGHDGVHRRIFNDRILNDRFCDLFIYGPIGLIMRFMDHNHLQHHHHFSSEKDPDRYKYGTDNKATKFNFLIYCLGLMGIFNQLKNIYFRKNYTLKSPELSNRKKKTCTDWIILLTWQFLLIIGLTSAIGWWAYPILWIIPVYLSILFDGLRSYCEHAEVPLDSTVNPSRWITHSSNRVERFFLAPMNMNFHSAHHLWPSIPYYNLPQVDYLIKERSQTLRNTTLIWKTTYASTLFSYYKNLPLPVMR